jgi:hypothetical protein
MPLAAQYDMPLAVRYNSGWSCNPERTMTPSSLPRSAMLAISFVQGLALLGLYRSIEDKFWPSEAPLWAFPLWTIAIAVPLLLLLSITRENIASAAKHVAAFGLVLALLAVYTGWQAEPPDAFPIANLTFAFVVSMGLACFKALMYLQQRADGVPLSYEVLFTNSWRNFLVGVLAAVFTLIFWLVLMLWGQLFEVIGIDFFEKLFTEDWFVIPVLTVAFGLGINLFRALIRVIDTISKLLHWLIKLLLPLVLVVAVIFLAALPFTGLDVLWETGNGTALMLWLLALLLFFTNAVYQDGREVDPYPPILHRAIYVGLAVMPIVALLSLYGLSLRLMQYGWTIERCWAFVVWLILTLFALGYVLGIVRRRDQWTAELAQVNKAMGLVVLAIMLLANSPLLDFRKISLHSQLGRIESGEIERNEFDYWYAKHHLARPGYLEMEHIKNEIGDTDPKLLAMIEKPSRQHSAVAADPEEFWNSMSYRPEKFEVPLALQAKVESTFAHVGYRETTFVFVRVDLDDDGNDEYALLPLHKSVIGTARLFYQQDGQWQSSYLSFNRNSVDGETRDSILDGEIRIVEPSLKDLSIGGIEFRPHLTD